MPVREETAIVDDFGRRYRARDDAAALDSERTALGTGCGVNGYTTLDQAHLLARRLRPTPGDRVLDLGCGCGWPGLLLAERYGCRVIGLDLPVEALARARANAARRRVGAHWILASARDLPLRGGAFDHVVHADVLC